MTGPHPHTHLTPIDPSHSANVKDLSAKTLQSYWETGNKRIERKYAKPRDHLTNF